MKILFIAGFLMAAGTAWSQQNYITSCSSSGLGCVVDEISELPGSTPGYHATFKSNYRFTCGATLNPYPSKAFAWASIDKASRGYFDYIGTGTVEVQGYGPVKFDDERPEELAQTYLNPKCGLFIDSFTVSPSPIQLSDWSAQRSAFMSNLTTIKTIYKQRPQVMFFAKMHETNPDSFRSIIQAKIDDLKSKLETDDMAELDLIQWEAILSAYPETALNEAFEKLNETAKDIIKRARAFDVVKVKAGQPKDAELETLATEVEKLY